ncbi:hypothetical protein HYR54_00555 [Candidatus Acetothermia bacterium]|nr:hypothetical protein [Candidatus Acetothermia bacterium]
MNRTIRITEETYSLLVAFAEKFGAALGPSADLLVQRALNGAVAGGRDLAIPFECVALLEESLGEGCLKDPERLRQVLGYLMQAAHFHAKAQKMFVCPRCGKPISWSPDDTLAQELRDYVTRSGWIHGECDR